MYAPTRDNLGRRPPWNSGDHLPLPTATESISVTLREWCQRLAAPGEVFATAEQRMAPAVRLTRENVHLGTGGPLAQISALLPEGG